MLCRLHLRHMVARSCVIAFQGGLEFDLARGFHNRCHADAVFIVPQGGIAACHHHMRHEDTGPQYIGFGHPAFVSPGTPVDPAMRRDIYFFAQVISPVTRGGRLHILKMLAAIARANPDRTVWLKLRHLPHENKRLLHRERYSYADLIGTPGLSVPDNLRLTLDSMEEILENASLGITCTSTAAVDLIRAGVPTLVYLDYVENYLDPLAALMRRLFSGSNLVAGLEDVLHLRAQAPDPAWLKTLFCPADRLVAQIQEAIEQFRQDPAADLRSRYGRGIAVTPGPGSGRQGEAR